jgi:MtaA/CmuA family methyltransferase
MGVAMNGVQRIQAAFRGEWPDKVPVMLHNFMMAAQEAGVSMSCYRRDARAAACCFIEAVEKYQYDGILFDMDTTLLAGAAGAPVDFPENQPARIHEGKLKTLEQVLTLTPVNVGDYGPIQVCLEAVSRLEDYFGDQILIRGNCDQLPFSIASMLRTPQEWMMDLCDPEREELVYALLEYCADLTSQFIRLMKNTGSPMTSNGDSPAGPEMISPAMYRRFALPYEERIVKLAHELDLPYILHICGKTDRILDDMLATGSDGLELDYKTDAGLAHEKMKKRTVFVGNIDPSGVLALGSATLVEQKTRDLLEVFVDTPRFILNAGCAIPATTPPENLKTMIRTARNFR